MRGVVTDLVGRWTPGCAAAAAAAAAAAGGGGGRHHGGGAGRVQWDAASVVAHQGDNVTLVCTVRALEFFDFVRLTLSPSSDYGAQPRHGGDDSAAQSWTVADNNVVKAPFVALPRYSVKMTVDVDSAG